MQPVINLDDAKRLFNACWLPGDNAIAEAVDLDVARDGSFATFTASIVLSETGDPVTRIGHVELASGARSFLTEGPGSDRGARLNPAMTALAFLSDRLLPARFQPFLLDLTTRQTRSLGSFDGSVEELSWSADGTQLLLRIAQDGAAAAGIAGAARNAIASQTPWMPTVESRQAIGGWRRLFILDVASGHLTPVGPDNLQVWEGTWCGPDHVLAICSERPDEGAWYDAPLVLIDLATQGVRTLLDPADQLGCPAASPGGRWASVIQAPASDRGLICGVPTLIDMVTGSVLTPDGIDVSHLEWISEERVLLSGHRGLETVVAVFDVATGRLDERWASRSLSTSGVLANAKAVGDKCILIGEGFARAPSLCVIAHGQLREIAMLAPSAGPKIAVERHAWRADDGLLIEGFLLCPPGGGPFPTIVCLHGGPVWHWKPGYLARSHPAYALLLDRGFALFLPNPRGSTGRGDAFARAVRGDPGGADAQDVLCGIDALIAQARIDSKRLGITGKSYGGFLTAWLVTRTNRFKAAVPVSPFTNWTTQKLTSNIGPFVDLFLPTSPDNQASLHAARSPVYFAQNASSPVMTIAGALDQCTPQGEALQFHNALPDAVLVTYPLEGHGVRGREAGLDFATRMLRFFESLVF